jgi:hypothetical protein
MPPRLMTEEELFRHLESLRPAAKDDGGHVARAHGDTEDTKEGN